MNDLLLTKKTIVFSRPSHCPAISHLAFADDMIIFSNGSKKSLQHLVNFLARYEAESGQLIKEKSCFVVGDNVASTRNYPLNILAAFYIPGERELSILIVFCKNLRKK